MRVDTLRDKRGHRTFHPAYRASGRQRLVSLSFPSRFFSTSQSSCSSYRPIGKWPFQAGPGNISLACRNRADRYCRKSQPVSCSAPASRNPMESIIESVYMRYTSSHIPYRFNTRKRRWANAYPAGVPAVFALRIAESLRQVLYQNRGFVHLSSQLSAISIGLGSASVSLNSQHSTLNLPLTFRLGQPYITHD